MSKVINIELSSSSDWKQFVFRRDVFCMRYMGCIAISGIFLSIYRC